MEDSRQAPGGAAGGAGDAAGACRRVSRCVRRTTTLTRVVLEDSRQSPAGGAAGGACRRDSRGVFLGGFAASPPGGAGAPPGDLPP